MFYSSRTILADSQCNAYWQENLGIYAGNNASSASPLIVGLFIHETNNPPRYNTMAGILAKVDSLLATYPHPMLYGFFIWIYEYMDDEDWTSWNSWVNTLPDKGIPPTTQPNSSPSPTQSPTPTPTASPSTSPTPTPLVTASPSPSTSPLSPPEETPAIVYIAIGIGGAVAAIAVALIFLRMRK
jgi:hypothetical protein